MENKNEDWDSLKNFDDGNYTRADYRRVRRLFSSENESVLKDSMQKKWTEIPEDQLLNDRLKRVLSVLKSLIMHSQPVSGRKKIFTFYQKIAALLFVPLLLSFLLWMLYETSGKTEATATIFSPPGARTAFVLPDGSNGWLNSGSSITYPVDFKTRNVKLTGEAYFDVVHQYGNPFQVTTDALSLQVLGTSFNVSAYSDDQEVSVILKEGHVRVTRSGISDRGYLLEPGEKFSYNIENRKATVSRVNAEEQTLWTQGILRFDGESLFQVMRKLGRWYNVDFEIRDKQLQNYNFRVTFKDEQLDEILRNIAISTPMKYRIENRRINKNGIYMKKKIIIEKK